MPCMKIHFCPKWEHQDSLTVNTSTQEVYNFEESSVIRSKMVGLALIQGGIGAVFNFTGQLISLCKGDVVSRAKHKARISFLEAKFKKGEVVDLTNVKVPLPGIVYHLFIELAIVIGKLALYPIFLVARELICLYGVISPLDGRGMLNHLDYLMAPSQEGIEEEGLPDLCWRYCAPCMQSKDHNRRANLVRVHGYYKANSGKATLHRIERVMRHFSFYIPKDKRIIIDSYLQVYRKASAICEVPALTKAEKALNSYLANRALLKGPEEGFRNVIRVAKYC